MLPNNGTYRSKTNGQIVLYEASTGALCLAIPVIMGGEDWQWSGKHTMTLVKADGTVQTKNVDTLKAVFEWDGQDPSWLSWEDDGETPRDLSSHEFDLVGEQEEFTPEGEGEQPRMTFKIKWLNTVGGGARMPEMADRKSILAKYGSKFRALSGVKPVSKPVEKSKTVEKPAEKPAAKTAPSAPTGKPAPTGPGGTAITATQDEAWQQLVKSRPNDTEEVLTAIWFAEIEKQFPGKAQNDLSIQQFGKLKTLWS